MSYGIDKRVLGEKDFKNRQFMLDLIAGGLAGSFSWLIGYPIDIVKTQIQVSTTDVAPTIK